jgi:ubiquinone/menaquinone biosynthesis C-methylase UbiE
MEMPAGVPWDHNSHYHTFLLAQAPAPMRHALDVGCGQGDFAGLLAARAERVDAIELDAATLATARRLQTGHTNLHFIPGDLMQLDLTEGEYDLITCLASLHHMDFDGALRKMKRLLAPGGTLAILGLYREASLPDYLISAVAVPINLIYRLALQRANAAGPENGVPVRPATMTLAQIDRAAARIVAGARLRRHLLWRYSLVWRKPIHLPEKREAETP